MIDSNSKTKCSNRNTCNSKDNIQEFPKTGVLLDNSNKTHNNLLKQIDDSEMGMELRSYLFDSIEIDQDGKSFIQTGCGPNWQGDYITLCTCKHMMRTAKSKPGEWKNIWIAGLKAKPRDNTKAYLVYLMKVENGFNSMYDIWNNLDKNVRNIKSASVNVFGDIYNPCIDKIKINNDESLFNPCSYQRPIKGHKHEHCWYSDIHYFYNNRYSSYLVGYQSKTFLWASTLMVLSHPFKKKFTQSSFGKEWKLGDFLSNLTDTK